MEKNEKKKVVKKAHADPSQRAWKFIRDCNGTDSEALKKTAVTDGVAEYTYGQMFAEWERYAAVFSALKMTGENHARVGLMGTTCPEVIFAFYALNMTGAEVSVISSYLSIKISKVLRTVKEEHLTDIIVTDEFAQADLVYALLAKGEQLGLRNILIIHMKAEGPTVTPMITAAQEYRYGIMKQSFTPLCMEMALKAFEHHEVNYAGFEGSSLAVILHTSGTTGGHGKPIPLSDEALNNICVSFTGIPRFASYAAEGDVRTAIIMDLSNGYGFGNQMHMIFSLGGCIGTVPWNQINPHYYQSVAGLSQTWLFGNPGMFRYWQKIAPESGFDFSKIRGVVTGGSALSATEKREVYEFLRKNGCGEVPMFTGYGLSEMAGSVIVDAADLTDDAMGYLMPGVEALLFNEDEEEFYTPAEAPCEGVLYLRSGSQCSGTLDGREVVKLEEIGGKKYLCTNDAVKVDETGKFTYLGRANRFFINESGKKYESGKVEAAVGREKGIDGACVVPVFVKNLHDNYPMLCVAVRPEEKDAQGCVEKALTHIFGEKKNLGEEQLPYKVLIAAELPKNRNGKVDIYRISRGDVEGTRYDIRTERKNRTVTGIRLEPVKKQLLTEEIISGIKADFMNKNQAADEEDKDMKLNGNAKETYDAMNQMGRQVMDMIKEMRTRREEEKKEEAGKFAGMFGMPRMFGGMGQFGAFQSQWQQQVQMMNQQWQAQFAQMQQLQQARMLKQMQEVLENLQELEEKSIARHERNAAKAAEFEKKQEEFVKAAAVKAAAFDRKQQEAVKAATVKATAKVAKAAKEKAEAKAEAKAEEVKEEVKKEEVKKAAVKKTAAKKTAAKKTAAKKTAVKKTAAAKTVKAAEVKAAEGKAEEVKAEENK